MRALIAALAGLLLLGVGGLGWTHPGNTDHYGGHTESKTGFYHVHNRMVAGNKRSETYHIPGGQFYQQMATTSKDKVRFGSVDDAERAGYRRSKR